ncbi:TniQ family protein [Robertmurraya sp. DFI.2.37]|uniref:TniQ family protein n=1 Tax=Robertmurraya sp. DFI.2.37 TaxID=3031819 RepID=UPI001248F57E|nr:TniQ family protein [Robertmurraya sp. DFI.2.37]MDF1511050.1 TniQ family protein [Robertmurraya sp. DFI.2.37]
MLLFSTEPHPGESLYSLLLRTAKSNFMDNPNWILQNFKDFSTLELIPNEINWLSDANLKKMSEFLSISYQKAKELSFHSTLSQHQLAINSIEKNPWFLYSRTKCCPLCLQESTYHKKNWSSSHSLICTKHGIFLIDACPDCNTSFKIQSIVENKCKRCNLSIDSVISKQIAQSSTLIKYQRIVDGLFTPSNFIYDHPYINNISSFIKVLEFIANWAVRILPSEKLDLKVLSFTYDGNAKERNSLKNAKHIEQAICIYGFAFMVLENWPLNFYKMLNDAENSKKKDFFYFVDIIVPSLYNSELSFIAIEFGNFIAHEKLRLPNRYNFVCTEQIKLLNDNFNASIIHSNLLPTYSYEFAHKNINLVSSEDFNSFLIDFENSFTKEKLKERWKTSSIATLSILENKFLNNAFNFRSGSVNTWVIPKDSVIGFEKKLAAFSTQLPEQPITTRQAIEWFGPKNANILFDGILSGKIKFNFNKSIGESWVCKDEVYEFVSAVLLKNGETTGFIPLRNLVFILGVKKSDIIYWLRTGRFASFSEISIDSIPIINVNHFLDNYHTTLQLSMIYKIPIKRLLKKHRLGKVVSLSGPHFNDGQRLLFSRNIEIF